jgi:hypothetical protein
MDLGLESKRVMITGTNSIAIGTPQEAATSVAFLAGTPASLASGANSIAGGAIAARMQC